MKVGELLEYVREEFEKNIQGRALPAYWQASIMNAYDRVTTRALVKFYDSERKEGKSKLEGKEHLREGNFI